MRSLTARLVVTTVALVALAAFAIGAATTVVMRSYLMDQLDQDVVGSLRRSLGPGFGPQTGFGVPGNAPTIVRGQGVGTLTAFVARAGESEGFVLANRPADNLVQDRPLPSATLRQLSSIELAREPQSVDLDGFGTYRILAIDLPQGRLVSGLPQASVDDAVGSLVRWEIVLVLLALGATGFGGLWVVRRQMAPLREVAATAHEVAMLPLSSGDVDLSARVDNPDEHTEVGQVGAALNTLLAHVEESLTARHRSEQQVRQFVADASHELRTPLSTIRGYSALATAHPEDLETLRESLAKVSTESERMSGLVEDLLLLARLDAGRELERQPVDLSRLVVEAVADARLLAPEHQWRLDLGDEPIEVLGDERSLRQVVTNLVANARIHTPPGTAVTVSVRPNALTVADDGPGFDDPEHALERFSRGDPARTSAAVDAASGPVTSTGLGLSIVDAIVRAHGGSVEIHSASGATTVTVRFS